MIVRRAIGLALALFAWALDAHAVPPEITGGPFLVDTPGTELQPILTYETSEALELTIFDSDPGETLTIDILVAGPIGGLIGGGLGMTVVSGVPEIRSVQFIAGVTPGVSWIEVSVSDGTSRTTRYVNFEVQENPSPPAGQFFEVGLDITHSPQQHGRFVVLMTDSAQVELAFDILAGIEPQQVLLGRVVKGSGGFNRNTLHPDEPEWSWHLDPASASFAFATVELCDGAACFIEENLEEWIPQVSVYCPWGAYIREVRSQPTPEPTIRVTGGRNAVVSWEPIPGASHHDLVRGLLSSLAVETCISVDLGPVTCMENDSVGTSSRPDAARPPPGDGFFYLLRYGADFGNSLYGVSSRAETRKALSEECPP